MVKRDIVICGEPVLRRKARLLHDIRQETVDLLADMVDTMLAASGVGLAAPQVGKSVQAIVVRPDVEADSPIHQLINPRLVEVEGEQEGREGCLSLPTLYGLVVRPERVLVHGLSPDGEEVTLEGEGLFARALAHEIDHLQGTLFIDWTEQDSLVWLVPDPEEEDGVRFEQTSLREAQEAFDRLREKHRKTEGA